eukprot:CAMPEP_0202049970 /NCGR_PEP_ID=MMETSP0963-20130614/3719_1 /ASSEMBLY_ACC=CAM_ASM_000494 /TAXON_ID=4773 /ORGANISM="Schizochytrium aggregatum, Strain ATCC28209" /LENGTH=55 /DNA_ID=CAMNT_0048615029 /DNA_START=212 /DNA_END=380 /DNA_ORIENTATION=-
MEEAVVFHLRAYIGAVGGVTLPFRKKCVVSPFSMASGAGAAIDARSDALQIRAMV